LKDAEEAHITAFKAQAEEEGQDMELLEIPEFDPTTVKELSDVESEESDDIGNDNDRNNILVMDSDDEYQPTEIKETIKELKEEKKEISREIMMQAVRWRLNQNDCQNRGYILDGIPTCYMTAQGIFYITPTPPEKKKVEPKLDEDGNPIDDDNAGDGDGDEEDPEALKKALKPKFQENIYPDSIIMLCADDQYLMNRAASLPKENNTKWSDDKMYECLQKYNEANDTAKYGKALEDESVLLPLARFF
jgi:hypothetical protein